MKTYAAILCALALPGCVMQSTYSQIMAKPPVQAFDTTRSVDEFLGCISPKIATVWPRVNTIQDGDASVLTVVGAQVLVTVRVSQTSTGAHVEVRQIYDGRGYQRASEAALACR
ncbi:hypothetical protein ABE488_09065 [Luteimonas sp. TWI662]|uniref:hypothetical protein n=1 Tax=Luteimonas sp. TWI662 TaxID=3136789 RepID=UPI0032094344